MTMRLSVSAGVVVGLMVSSAALALLAYGVAGVLTVTGIDLMYILWPASLMLTTGWRTTVPGVTLTIISVFLNCVTYSSACCYLASCFVFCFQLKILAVCHREE